MEVESETHTMMPLTPESPKTPCSPSRSARQSLRGKATIQKLEQKLRAAQTHLTAYKQAAKQLRLSEIQYREIFNSATDGLLIFDLKGNIVEANPQVCKMHQYSHKEFLTLTAKDFIHSEYYHLFHQFKKDMRHKGEFQAEVIHVRRDGSLFPIDVRGTDIVYKGAKHLLGIIRDITDRKRAEEALRKSEKELRALSSKLLSVQEDEKKRLARDLHDGFGQTLIAIKFGVENSLRELEGRDPATAAQSLEEVIAIVRRAIDEVRRVTTDLRPTILDNLGIVATISWFCQEFQSICPAIRVKEHVALKEKQVPRLLKSTIFRILQEAFTNIAKHSKATLAHVALAERGRAIELLIRDNGRGFDPEKLRGINPSSRGMGLTSMHERTMLSGGTFSIASEPGKGTSVRATWSTGKP
jgi:PAS domain S-box-containing protein